MKRHQMQISTSHYGAHGDLADPLDASLVYAITVYGVDSLDPSIPLAADPSATQNSEGWKIVIEKRTRCKLKLHNFGPTRYALALPP